MERWPNFFIVGAPKAGTTSLYRYLQQHPQIYFPEKKEPHYFSYTIIPDDHFRKPIRDKKKYLKLFENAKDEKIIGESSTSYLADPKAADLIHEVSPNARILISLRDPVERIFSTYLMLKRLYKIKSSFNEQIQKEYNQNEFSVSDLKLKRGLYSKHVKRYFDIFDSKQIKIIIFEEWIKNPKSIVEEILKFLDLKILLGDFEEKIYNPFVISRGRLLTKIRTNDHLSKVTKRILPQPTRTFLRNNFFIKDGVKPKMEKEERDFLINFYRDDVNKLQTLLGRKLPWVNFQNIEGFNRD